MKKQKEHHIINDINSFDEEVSIYKVLFQDRTTAMLKYLIDKLSNDRYENRNCKLPSVLIAGKEGKQLVARAFINSTCYNYEHIQGQHLGMGGHFGTLYTNSDTETVYYISSADRLSAFSVSWLHQYITQGYIKFRDHIKDESVTITGDNKMFIFSVNNTKKLCPDLHGSTEYHCQLKDYNTSEMEIIVEQRLKWCGIDHQKQVPAIIVHNGAGSISNCIRLLSVCNLIMMADGRTKITIKDVEIGIGLNRQEKRAINAPA